MVHHYSNWFTPGIVRNMAKRLRNSLKRKLRDGPLKLNCDKISEQSIHFLIDVIFDPMLSILLEKIKPCKNSLYVSVRHIAS